MLTPLQAEVRRIIGRLGKDQDFALAGGAALIVYGIVDRPTRDLDFFAPSGVVVDSFVEQVEQHLRSLSFRTERLTEYPQLVRMRIEFENEELMIDIGVNYRSFPPRGHTRRPGSEPTGSRRRQTPGVRHPPRIPRPC